MVSLTAITNDLPAGHDGPAQKSKQPGNRKIAGLCAARRSMNVKVFATTNGAEFKNGIDVNYENYGPKPLPVIFS